MKVAKQAVQYYTMITGNEWSTFYDNLDSALAEENPTGDLFIIKRLMDTIVKSGISVNEFKMNKDAVKALFDNDSRKANGEFFTPIVWAKELYTYIDKFIPNWRTDFNIWENSCYDIDTKVVIRRKVEEFNSPDFKEFLSSKDVDIICCGDKCSLDKSEAPRFNNLDWIYDDCYTFIGRISPKLLKEDDEILTMDKNTGEVSWSGYHNLFFKTSNKIIRFFFGKGVFDFATTLKITPDHQMVVRFKEDNFYSSITATDLCEKLDRGIKCYARLRNGFEVQLDSYDVFNIEREVWDLTTNNETHCFCVSPSDSVDIFSGNCYSMDTEIFTNRGWVLYNDLLDDDLIYTLNPNTLIGEWSGFHNRFKKKFKGNMINFRGSKVDVLVTPDHSMFCLNNRDKSPISVSAEDIFNKYQCYTSNKTTAYKVVISAESLQNPFYNEDLAKKALCDFNINDLSILWKLIGIYIGDGGFFRNNYGKINALKFSYKKDRKIEVTRNILDELGISYNVYDYRDSSDDKFTFRVNDKRLLNFIEDFVGFGYNNKKLPLSLVDVNYLSDLLFGLIATDGHTYELKETSYASREYLRFWTANKELADDVELLATLLGYSVHTAERSRKSTHSDKMCKEYNITFSGKSTFDITKNNIVLVPYDDYVWDLTTNNDNHIFLVRRNGKTVFSKNCGSGNLLRESKADMSHVYMSSLQEDDITLVKNTPEFEGVNAFQCDFLEGIDYDEYNTEFLDKLPPRLKEIIVNDEPLLIICNPPYKTGSAKATDVGRYMCDIGLGRPAYDIFYQFCWRVMRFVEMFNLKNCYYAFFGPLTFFTGAGANILLTEFEHCFEFLDGMCISAQEFSDTSESILWGIGGTVWKSRGGYQQDQDHKDILLEKKYLLPDGGVGCEGRVLYAPPREKLSDWVAPKDVIFYENAPLMTSHLTFKGSEVLDKVAPKSGRLADNALGTLMVGNTLTRSADQSAILSMPSTIQYVSITEENFWRCVASYTFRRTIDAGWAIAKKEISAPDTTVEGYNLWLKNALVMFLFEYKSMMSSMRGVQWSGYNNYIIRNKLFYLTEEEIRANCHDEVILRDLEKYPLENQFMLEKIKECEPYWAPEIRALYDWCKNYTLFSYDKRKDVNYKGSLDCADAGFQQLRTGGLWNDNLSEELTKIIVQARDYMRKDLDKFGFVTETEDVDL